VIRFEGVTKIFVTHGQRKVVLDNTSVNIDTRYAYGIFGPNGAGKSTTLRLIAGSDIPNKGKITKAVIQKRVKELTSLFSNDDDAADELAMLKRYKKLMDDEADTKTAIKKANDELEYKVIAQYPKLTVDEIKAAVVDAKWMAAMEQRIRTEMDNISHRLTQRINELADRYETPLPQLETEVDVLEQRVKHHLTAMGF
jgi:type I restriction enzyme M protein